MVNKDSPGVLLCLLCEFNSVKFRYNFTNTSNPVVYSLWCPYLYNDVKVDFPVPLPLSPHSSPGWNVPQTGQIVVSVVHCSGVPSSVVFTPNPLFPLRWTWYKDVLTRTLRTPVPSHSFGYDRVPGVPSRDSDTCPPFIPLLLPSVCLCLCVSPGCSGLDGIGRLVDRTLVYSETRCSWMELGGVWGHWYSLLFH